MISTELNALKSYILTNNNYFDNGYANVSINPEIGYVEDNDVIVFPNDTIGDYFYLRNDGPSSLVNLEQAFMAEGTFGAAMGANLQLVAFMRNADEAKLLKNLLATISSYSTTGLVFRNLLYKTEDVVARELSNISEENRLSALQRISEEDFVMVSVGFTLFKAIDYFAPICITKPCKEC